MEHRSFSLENLEARALFSVTVPLHALPITPTSRHPATTAPAVINPLIGSFNSAGTYTQPFSRNPDGGPNYHFTGTGKKKTLGSFTLVADLHGPGFVAQGTTTGYITLTTAKGTLILKVNGPPQAPGSLPGSLTFRIVNSSGAYAGSSGRGHIAISASDTTHKFVFRFNPA